MSHELYLYYETVSQNQEHSYCCYCWISFSLYFFSNYFFLLIFDPGVLRRRGDPAPVARAIRDDPPGPAPSE